MSNCISAENNFIFLFKGIILFDKLCLDRVIFYLCLRYYCLFMSYIIF